MCVVHTHTPIRTAITEQGFVLRKSLAVQECMRMQTEDSSNASNPKTLQSIHIAVIFQRQDYPLFNGNKV